MTSIYNYPPLHTGRTIPLHFPHVPHESLCLDMCTAIGRTLRRWVERFRLPGPGTAARHFCAHMVTGEGDKITMDRADDPPKRDERGGRISEMSDNSEAIRLDATKKEIAAQGIQQDRPKVNRIASTKKDQRECMKERRWKGGHTSRVRVRDEFTS